MNATIKLESKEVLSIIKTYFVEKGMTVKAVKIKVGLQYEDRSSTTPQPVLKAIEVDIDL